MRDDAPVIHRVVTRIRKRWRVWVRHIHRDVGYLAVGLTIVYALSGIAVNHIEDWDPNFRQVDAMHTLSAPLPDNDLALAVEVFRRLGIDKRPNAEDIYRTTDTDIEIYVGKRTLRIDQEQQVIFDEGASEPRLFFHLANWLHLNRGKAAWTYFADGYAVFLLFLAISGMFMLPGRRGLIGRGGILVLVGLSVPLLYIHFSGGP